MVDIWNAVLLFVFFFKVHLNLLDQQVERTNISEIFRFLFIKKKCLKCKKNTLTVFEKAFLLSSKGWKWIVIFLMQHKYWIKSLETKQQKTQKNVLLLHLQPDGIRWRQMVEVNAPLVVERGSPITQRESWWCSSAQRLWGDMGISLKLETQQRARAEVKAHTIWLGSEASIPLQRRTPSEAVSHSGLLASCKQQDSHSCCQEKLHGWREGGGGSTEGRVWGGKSKQILKA